MDLTRYVERLRADLADAAAAGGPEAAEAAQRLSLSLDPAFRMSLMEALSDAAAEISAELDQASVEVRLRGREPELVVHETEPAAPQPAPAPETADPETEPDDDGSVARITVRVPEALKNRAEELAADASQSLNAWIVQAIRGATRERSIDIDLGSMRFRSQGAGHGGQKRFQGWSR